MSRGLLLCGLPLLTTGCVWPGSGGSPITVAPPTPPSRPGLERSAAPAGLGLQPLPTPQQVTQAVRQGRVDPFSDPRPPAPATVPASARASLAPPPAGSAPASGAAPRASAAASIPARVVAAVPALQLSGVIQSGGRPEAIVVMGSQSDSLRIGQQGSDKNSLLPPGWRVESININSCSLVLKKGSLLHSYNCDNS